MNRKAMSTLLFGCILAACAAPVGGENTSTASQPIIADLGPLQSRGLCLDVYAFNTGDGWNTLDLWDCNGLDNQAWFYNEETHEIISKSNGKCLDQFAFNNFNVGMWECNGLANQKWTLTDGSGGTPAGEIRSDWDGKCVRSQWWTHAVTVGRYNVHQDPAFFMAGCQDSDWQTYEVFSWAWWRL